MTCRSNKLNSFANGAARPPVIPKRGLTPGVETTTGPLGQGFANGVGMAIAEDYLAARYNRPGHQIVNHYTYALVSDGDLMEGVSAEAASLAGHLKLGKLIYLYDDNHITLSAATHITFTEDRAKRFEAYGWHTQTVENGNDLAAIDRALRAAQAEKERPSLILVRTHIGYGSPHKQDTFEAHGSPLGEEEVKLTKQALGWPLDPPFYIPDKALAHFRLAVENGKQAEAEWEARFSEYSKAFPDLAKEFQQGMAGELPEGWDTDIPIFPADPKGMATRVASGKVLNAIESETSLVDRRLRRSRSVHPHGAYSDGRFREPAAASPATCKDRRAAAGVMRDATCTLVCASTRWDPSRMGWQCMAASFRLRRRSSFSRTTCGHRFGWRR